MDSGNNSASLQSSSGGDEDSRAASSFSPPFMNQQFSRQPPPTQYNNTQITPSMFLPSSGFNFENQNPFLNLDMLTWSKSFRSADPPPPQTIQALVPGVRPSSSPEQGTTASSSSRAGGVGPVRSTNAKKRSRASRRAPTTVLTTDTTNFKAMVQEFTGIPAPPFSTRTATTRANQHRLDLFSNTPPHYGVLRQQQQPFLQQPTTPIVSTTNNKSNNFQLPTPMVNSDDRLPQVNSNNPMLSFQSLLQTTSSTPNYSLPSFNNMLSGMEATGTSSVSSTTMMMRRRTNISYDESRQQQEEDLGAATASRSEGMVESWICSSD